MTETKKEVKEVKKTSEKKSIVNGKTKKAITKASKKVGQYVITIACTGIGVFIGNWLYGQLPSNGKDLEDVL